MITPRLHETRNELLHAPQSTHAALVVNREAAIIAAAEHGEWISPLQLKQVLHEAVAEGSSFAVDLGGLSHLDVPSLQALLAAHLELERRGSCLKLVNVSGEMRNWLRIAGAPFSFHNE